MSKQARHPWPAPVAPDYEGDGKPVAIERNASTRDLYHFAMGRNDLWAPGSQRDMELSPKHGGGVGGPVRVTVYRGTTARGKPIVHAIYEARPNTVKRAMVEAGYYSEEKSGLYNVAEVPE